MLLTVLAQNMSFCNANVLSLNLIKNMIQSAIIKFEPFKQYLQTEPSMNFCHLPSSRTPTSNFPSLLSTASKETVETRC